MKVKDLYLWKYDESGFKRSYILFSLHKLQSTETFRNEIKNLTYNYPEQWFKIEGYYTKKARGFWDYHNGCWYTRCTKRQFESVGKKKLMGFLRTVFPENEIEIRTVKFHQSIIFKMKPNSMIILNEIK